jgi:hypothetical protein
MKNIISITSWRFLGGSGHDSLLPFRALQGPAPRRDPAGTRRTVAVPMLARGRSRTRSAHLKKPASKLQPQGDRPAYWASVWWSRPIKLAQRRDTARPYGGQSDAAPEANGGAWLMATRTRPSLQRERGPFRSRYAQQRLPAVRNVKKRPHAMGGGENRHFRPARAGKREGRRDALSSWN